MLTTLIITAVAALAVAAWALHGLWAATVDRMTARRRLGLS